MRSPSMPSHRDPSVEAPRNFPTGIRGLPASRPSEVASLSDGAGFDRIASIVRVPKWSLTSPTRLTPRPPCTGTG